MDTGLTWPQSRNAANKVTLNPWFTHTSPTLDPLTLSELRPVGCC
jgi:hypothetical protein